ncbi:PP2C family protein-serine/threonine phosphatase [Rahnella aceris]|uniref:PP2C family protein-serine/threonine phosphatase n=1 Tax=Rahnella sp. (strain Y9602) TaxID=2703885 RepID=UPI001F536489|nr:protein phosphatase 2C domain-containing protein [Rahnella aceris]UNK55640.1 protein phosphatase 2C domain-containing protein [Rahnella aceris]
MISMILSSTFSFPKGDKKDNEDSILWPKRLQDGYIMAIADGVGGYEGGKNASHAVISYLSDLENNITQSEIENIFINLKDKVKSLSFDDKKLASAATTITFCYVGENSVLIGHSGDCRLYFKTGAKLTQITKDHTQHQILIDKGIYTARQLKNAPGGNVITTAISGKIELDYQLIEIPKDDLPLENNILTLYIMSDGAHNIWEKRPRFSVNTLSNPSRFSSSLQKRIETLGAMDDYSLVGASIHF